jgi:hypothetical protein
MNTYQDSVELKLAQRSAQLTELFNRMREEEASDLELDKVSKQIQGIEALYLERKRRKQDNINRLKLMGRLNKILLRYNKQKREIPCWLTRAMNKLSGSYDVSY